MQQTLYSSTNETAEGHMTTDLRVRMSGHGNRVLFVHGVGANLESWNGVIAAMGEGFECLRYDLRGHGQSPKTDGEYSLEMFVSDLAAVASTFEWDKFHLVGFSLGGLVAQRFALEEPARVRSLAVISSIAGRTAEEALQATQRLETLKHAGASTHVAAAAERWFSEDFRKLHPEVVAARVAQSISNDPACYAAAYRILACSDLAESLHLIKAPTLAMTGEQDIGSTPRTSRLMAERIPNARAVILPGLRHSLLLEAPDVVGAELATFIQESSDEPNRR
jgi:pimeloyl-ACP methyl ester carboxylesterase